MQFLLSSKRRLSGDVSVWIGEFYDGQRQRYGGRLLWLPWKHLGLDLNYHYNQVQLPGGNFDTHLFAGRMNWNFTPDLIWSHLLQFDSVSDSLGFHSRLQWEYRPGCKFHLILNQNYDQQTGEFRLNANEFIVKATVVLR